MTSQLLSRFAENIFWLGRYMERVENLARILDVNETFARDSRGGHEWLPVLQLNADEDRFFERYKKPTGTAVVTFYISDSENPTSILSSLHMARENARGLRHLISTEMWLQLNVFYNEVASLKRRELALVNLSQLCERVKEACQAHAGITDGTLYRDEAWSFYHIGKFIERADQTSRLLDISYHRLTNASDDGGAPPDISQWNALLRSVAGYHAYRRTHPRGISPETVVAFLIYDRDFPRSMATCIRRILGHIEHLEDSHDLAVPRGLASHLRHLKRQILTRSRKTVRRDATNLHKFVDAFQLELFALSDELSKTYFARGAKDG